MSNSAISGLCGIDFNGSGSRAIMAYKVDMDILWGFLVLFLKSTVWFLKPRVLR